MGFPVGDLLALDLFIGAQTCRMFENDLMVTCKRLKETDSNSKARI